MTDFLDALQAPGGLVRHISAVVCIVAFGMTLWRLFGRWRQSGVLLRWVAGLLAALELVVACATARAAALQAPLNEAQYAIIAHALVVVFVMTRWRRLEQLPLPLPLSTERRRP